jgi:maltodextrin utilization protein YvdJ
MLAMVAFCVSIFFLNLTYSLYLPALAGISVAVYYAAQEEFRLRSLGPSLERGVEDPNWMSAHGRFAGSQIRHTSDAG